MWYSMDHWSSRGEVHELGSRFGGIKVVLESGGRPRGETSDAGPARMLWSNCWEHHKEVPWVPREQWGSAEDVLGLFSGQAVTGVMFELGFGHQAPLAW